MTLRVERVENRSSRLEGNRSRICLLTPGHLATNPRLVKEADALSDAGYDVKVICTRFVEWATLYDASFEGRPWKVAARIPFGPLAPRCSRLKQVLRQRAARAALSVGIVAEVVREADLHPASPDIASAALGVKADLYIAHYPAALPAAAKAASRHGALYAYDAEDFHLGDLPEIPEHVREKARLRAIESRYLPGAAYVSAASPGIADAYAMEYGIARPAEILNVFPLGHAPAAATPRGTVEPGPSLYWFSQTIGPERGLEAAVAAIGLSKSKPHLFLRGRPASGYIDHLKSLAASAEVAARIHVLDIAAPHDMERLAAAYDLGLVAETANSRNREICLTNKLFSYVLAGVPALMSATLGQAAFAESHGLQALVFPINDADALGRRLDELLLNPQLLERLRLTCFGLGQDRYNWERESLVLLDVVGRALANRFWRERTHA